MPTIQGQYRFVSDPSFVMSVWTGDATLRGDIQMGGDPWVDVSYIMFTNGEILFSYGPDDAPNTLWDPVNGWSTFGFADARAVNIPSPIEVSDGLYNLFMAIVERTDPEMVTLTLINPDGTTALTLEAPSPVTSYMLYESSPDTWTFQAFDPEGNYAEGYLTLSSEYDNVGLAYSAAGDIIPRTGPFTWGTDQTLYIRVYNPVELELYDAKGTFKSRIYNDTAEYINTINIINYDQYYDDLDEPHPGHAYVWINNDTDHGASIAYPEQHALRGFATSIGGPVLYTPGVNYVPQLSGTVRLYLVTGEIPVLGNGELTLYNNKAEASRLDKTGYLSDAVTVKGTFRENTSFTDPEVEICVSADVALSHNYLYSSDMRRWYYIRNIEAISHQVFRLQLHVDVLMTYKDDLLNTTGYCTRNQFQFNPFYMDGRDPRSVVQKQLYIGPDRDNKLFKADVNVNIVTTFGAGS